LDTNSIDLIISHKYKFIFIKTVKTAGTSLEVYYSQFAGGSDVLSPVFPHESHHLPRNYLGLINPFKERKKYGFTLRNRIKEAFLLRKFYNHIPAYLVRERVPKPIWNSYFKFCVERNPWDKSVSHFYMMKKRNPAIKDFDHYLYHTALCHNYPLYTDPNTQEVLVDRVLSYDRLDEELDFLFSHLGLPFSGRLDVFCKANFRANGKPYQEYYNEKSKEYIYKKFKQEIDLMQFEF